MQSIGKGHHSDGDDDDEFDDEQNEMNEITNLNQQTELRKELIATIEEALREQEALRKHNMDLQHQIMLMEPAAFDQPGNPSEGHGAKSDAQQMNEHKYLNTLANVHQVRFNLKET